MVVSSSLDLELWVGYGHITAVITNQLILILIDWSIVKPLAVDLSLSEAAQLGVAGRKWLG